MAIMDNLKRLVGLEEEEDFEDDYEDEEYYDAPPRKPAQPSSRGLGPVDPGHERIWDQQRRQSSRHEQQPARKSYSEGNVVPINPNVVDITRRYKIVVVEPKSLEDCPKLVDNLKARKPIIINLEKVETETALKIFDFLNGATYALSGNVQKISNNIFVFLPENVDVQASSDKGKIDWGKEGSDPWKA
jgi:cell division inhibitor SepF